MTDTPWQGDACSLVDAFRAGERSPVEELEVTLAAIEASDLNCFTYVDADRARETAKQADVSLPFGGVPDRDQGARPGRGLALHGGVAGVPGSQGAVHEPPDAAPLRARRRHAGRPDHRQRVRWPQRQRHQDQRRHPQPVAARPTVGGSSGGSAAAVAGGLVSLATGGDGGGSIRIPAGYTGLLGMKGTFGRIPRSPHAYMRPHTVVLGNLSRSVRDAARFYDVCAGVHPEDPTSLPSPGGWEAGLGAQDLRGLRVAVVPNLGGVDARARRGGPHPRGGQGPHRRQPTWWRSTCASSRRTSPPSG